MIPYITIVGIFRAGGDTRTGFFIDIVNVFLFGVPVTCLLGFVFHVSFPILVLGMYMAEDSVKCAMCLVYYKSRKWIRRLTGEPESPPPILDIAREG
jgi:Na+-driven multidrug efflux pump